MRFDWEQERLTSLQQRLARLWTLVEPSEIVTDCTDPDDNRVLECAVASHATHIVTGDRELLAEEPDLRRRQPRSLRHDSANDGVMQAGDVWKRVVRPPAVRTAHHLSMVEPDSRQARTAVRPLGTVLLREFTVAAPRARWHPRVVRLDSAAGGKRLARPRPPGHPTSAGVRCGACQGRTPPDPRLNRCAFWPTLGFRRTPSNPWRGLATMSCMFERSGCIELPTGRSLITQERTLGSPHVRSGLRRYSGPRRAGQAERCSSSAVRPGGRRSEQAAVDGHRRTGRGA